MSNIENVKKELFLNFDKFNAFINNQSNGSPENLREMLSINKKLFENLREVLQIGSDSDKKEAMELFSSVMKTFGAFSKQLVASSGISPEMMQRILSSAGPGYQITDPEHVKMVERLGKDLEKRVT